jgi:excisionase family DNA binding protein
MDAIDGLWTYQSVAQKLQVHPRTISRWCKRFKLTVWRPTTNTVRIPNDQVQLLLAKFRGSYEH